MDNASSIAKRLEVLRILHANGIYSVLFMSPIFPRITDFKAIVNISKDYVDEYWFENLNLRGNYKRTILSYINYYYPQFADLYNDIYQKGNMEYWNELAIEIERYCNAHSIKHINYFYHKDLVQAKLGGK